MVFLLRPRIQPWIQAARPAAHPMIFIPLFIGQALAWQMHGHQQHSLTFFLYTFLFGVLFQIYLLYLNDHADEAIDRTNEQYWLSGGSRVLPEGKLRASDLLLGANVVLVAMVGLTLILALFLDRPWMPVGAALAIGLCWAYNLHPLQLSYRGYGEILQGLGCGGLLPLIGFYMQQGSLQGFPWSALIPLYLIFHAGNIITALPDFSSDRAGGKRTCPVRHGEYRARKTVLFLLCLACVSVVFANLFMSPIALALIVIPCGLMLTTVVTSGVLQKASVANFPICKKFVCLTSASQAWLLCAWAAALLMDNSL